MVFLVARFKGSEKSAARPLIAHDVNAEHTLLLAIDYSRPVTWLSVRSPTVPCSNVVINFFELCIYIPDSGWLFRFFVYSMQSRGRERRHMYSDGTTIVPNERHKPRRSYETCMSTRPQRLLIPVEADGWLFLMDQ